MWDLMRFRALLLGCCLLLAHAAHAWQTPAGAAAAGFDPTPLQREVLAAISGESEIRPGIKLANRFAPESKQATRDYLTTVLKRFGLEAMPQPYGSAGGVNLYAVLPATTPATEAIVFGAHYDSVRVTPGANDDGSGVVAVVAVAQAMTAITPRSRDLIFAFFDEEERGLVGSRAFAQMLKDEKRAIHSVHTIDQMGWDSNHNRAIELEIPYDGAEDLYRQAAATLKMDIPIFTTPETGSDHVSFRRLGYKAVGITEEYRHQDTTPFIHKSGDTFQTIDFDYLASTTRLMVEVMRALTR
jgi:hypothetical protein